MSRRLSFIKRLDDTVQVHLRLGKITPTHARELACLPRGKQEAFLKLVIAHNLTSRQAGLLVKKYLGQKLQKSRITCSAILWKPSNGPVWKPKPMTAV